MISSFANPQRFLSISAPLAAICGALAVIALPIGLWLSLFVAPPEQDQSEAVRIMFVHVPSAWLALMLYAAMGVASFVFFVWRHAIADVAAKAIAPIGAAFAFLTLATGSLWGRPSWNTWWEWDARLASMLVLFLIYLGYIALRAAFRDDAREPRAAAIFCMVGLVNLPIVKFSVDWWTTLHQSSSVIRLDGPSMPAEFLQPLLVMALALHALVGALIILRMRAEIFERRAESIERRREAA